MKARQNVRQRFDCRLNGRNRNLQHFPRGSGVSRREMAVQAEGHSGARGGEQGPSLSDKCRGQWPSPPRETLVDFFKQMSEVRGSEWPMIGIRPLHRTLIVGSNLRIVPTPALAPAPAPSPVFTQSPASASAPAYAPAS